MAHIQLEQESGPNPEDIEYLTQEHYGSIPNERLIKIRVIDPINESFCFHWFDLELLALWVRINPSNPLTRVIFTPFELWTIIVKYNNYLDSPGVILTQNPQRYIYSQNQHTLITNEINQSVNNNIQVRENIIGLINTIRTGENNLNNQPNPVFNRIQDIIRRGSNTNSVYQFVLGSRYIYIENATGIIGITEPYSNTIDRIPRFGPNNISMSLTHYLFYQNNNINQINQFPRPILPTQLVIGLRYIVTTINDPIMARTNPFSGFDRNGHPTFTSNIDNSSVIFHRNYHHFYNENELNQIGINLI